MSLFLYNDLYQFNMVHSYCQRGINRNLAVVDVFYRNAPYGNTNTIFAGLQHVAEYLTNFCAKIEDLNYLTAEGFNPDFVEHLSELKFTGSLFSVQEGEFVLPNVPFMRLFGPLEEIQLVETAILAIVNHETMIATTAARFYDAADGKPLYELGARRAHNFDAGIWGSRSAIIGGFSATSNMEAGRMFGLPTIGSHAHMFVSAFETEYEAFKIYCQTHRECILLVDTYNTLKSGVPNVIRLLKEGYKNIIGIRLDSGNLINLSKQARAMLDKEGFNSVKILVSNDLDVWNLCEFVHQEAPIDMYGVGTKLITAYDHPSLGAVYKLCAIENDEMELIPKMKISSTREKSTLPGVKTVYRQDKEDLICLTAENPPGKRLMPLVIHRGRLLKELPSALEARLHFISNNREAHSGNSCITIGLKELRDSMIKEITEKIK